jgi:transposase-like protein
MATRTEFELNLQERKARHFSQNFKIIKVREIESGATTVSQIKTQYQVSWATIYRWIHKFGSMSKKQERLIVETQSDTQELLALKKRVAELERIVGQKQILIDFKDKMIEIAEEQYGVDIKKKFSTTPSGTSGTTENNTPSA